MSTKTQIPTNAAGADLVTQPYAGSVQFERDDDMNASIGCTPTDLLDGKSMAKATKREGGTLHKRSRRRHRSPIAAVLAGGAIVLASLALTGSPASAGTFTYHSYASFTANGVNIRTGPGTGYAVVGSGFSGQKWCWDSQGYGGWSHGMNMATGKRGWVSTSYVNIPSGKQVVVPGLC